MKKALTGISRGALKQKFEVFLSAEVYLDPRDRAVKLDVKLGSLFRTFVNLFQFRVIQVRNLETTSQSS